jgi:hypothetical protein
MSTTLGRDAPTTCCMTNYQRPQHIFFQASGFWVIAAGIAGFQPDTGSGESERGNAISRTTDHFSDIRRTCLFTLLFL